MFMLTSDFFKIYKFIYFLVMPKINNMLF